MCPPPSQSRSREVKRPPQRVKQGGHVGPVSRVLFSLTHRQHGLQMCLPLLQPRFQEVTTTTVHQTRWACWACINVFILSVPWLAWFAQVSDFALQVSKGCNRHDAPSKPPLLTAVVRGHSPRVSQRGGVFQLAWPLEFWQRRGVADAGGGMVQVKQGWTLSRLMLSPIFCWN